MKLVNRYFTVIREEHDNSGIIYSLEIKWNMDAITEDLGENGFIVQRVSVTNTTGVPIGFWDDYFEAWEVNDGFIETKDDEFDDRFTGYPSYMCESAQSDVLYRPSKIEYNCVVYWVDIKDPAYAEVEKWPKSSNPNAGELRCCLSKDCKTTFKDKVIDRPAYVHEIY